MGKATTNEYIDLMNTVKELEKEISRAEDLMSNIEERMDEMKAKGGVDFDYIGRCEELGVI